MKKYLSQILRPLKSSFLTIIITVVPLAAFCQTSDFYKGKKVFNGVLLQSGSKKLSIQFINQFIVRTRFVPEGDFKDNGTGVCISQNIHPIKLQVTEREDSVILKAAALVVKVSKLSGSISYYTTAGKLLLAENPANPRQAEKITLNKTTFNDAASNTVKTANGDQTTANISGKQAAGTAWKARQQFVWQNGEALYGLGSHQEDYMNLRGKRQFLYEYNLKKSMPVLMSTKGYGLLFDAGCAMIFNDVTEESYMDMLAVNQVDYYLMYGPDFDQIVHQFRTLTGKVELPPKYMFGYIQSKERYVSPHDIDSVVHRFRSNQIPLDVIVQDWQYWPNGLWGYKKFDPVKYPDPDKMIDTVHKRNAHFMLSIWPELAANEEKEMGTKGYILGRRIYDAYNPAARKMYWDDYVGKNLFSKGVDAWWGDSSEPVEYDWNRGSNGIANDPAARFEKNVKVMADLLGDLRVNTFSLHHTQGIYENQRKTGSQKRVVILTRASYPGQQRYGTMVWNGDTKATWADFKSWIPGGLNYMATGSPYWTIDAGAFFVKSHSEWFWKGDFPTGTADLGYREFYVRNIQYAGWLPLFRSHGTDFAREPWEFGAKGNIFYDAIIKQINLRYRMLPFIYSVAAMVTNQDYTMTRPLAFDFRNDPKVYDIKDQFLFGDAFMICPVTDPMYYKPGSVALTDVAKTKEVYLPSGTTWYNFWTGSQTQGGKSIVADAPIDHIPVFISAGSIVPMGTIKQYAEDKPGAELEIRIYAGKNGKFTIYDDEGDTYNYQKGKHTTFEIIWNDKQRMVTISDRKGYFDGMQKNQRLNLVLVKDGYGVGLNEAKGKMVSYDGKKVNIRL